MKHLLITAALAFPISADARPLHVSGSYSFDGNADVDAFSFSFDHVFDYDGGSGSVALPLSSGGLTVGSLNATQTLWLWFRSSPFGDLGALITTQSTQPTFNNDYAQISGVFGYGITRDTVGDVKTTVPLMSLDYVIMPGRFSFGSNFGLGTLTVDTPAVPLPASGAFLVGALALLAVRRRRND